MAAAVAVAAASVGAALEKLSAWKWKKTFGSTYARKIKAKKTSQSTIRATPKSVISAFDNGGLST
jgi:hypothetical protein